MEIAGLPLKSLVSWRGRISRVQFLFCAIIFMFAGWLLFAPVFFLVFTSVLPFEAVIFGNLFVLLPLSGLFTSLLARRAHDLGMSGWIPVLLMAALLAPQLWMQLSIMPLTNAQPTAPPAYLIWLLGGGTLVWLGLMAAFLFVKGKAEPNRYGDPPKAIV